MTKQGLGILAGVGGGNLAVSAWAGSGTVPPEDLQKQTALVDAKQQLAVIEDGMTGNTRYTRLQVINDDVTEKYEINQLGIFVSVDGAEPVLYYIAQNPDGDIIPSNKSVKGFKAEYLTALIFAIGDNVEYDGTVSGFITPDALDARLAIFRTELEVFFDSGMNAVISDTEPTETAKYWLKPMGKISLPDALGIQTGQPVSISGVHVGDMPPDDTGQLWVRPLTV